MWAVLSGSGEGFGKDDFLVARSQQGAGPQEEMLGLSVAVLGESRRLKFPLESSVRRSSGASLKPFQAKTSPTAPTFEAGRLHVGSTFVQAGVIGNLGTTALKTRLSGITALGNLNLGDPLARCSPQTSLRWLHGAVVVLLEPEGVGPTGLGSRQQGNQQGVRQ